MQYLRLTIDDGPFANYLPSICKILNRHNVKATFFLAGNCVECCDWLVRQVDLDGHQIGNHSYSHPSFLGLSDWQVLREIRRTESLLKGFNNSVKLFRPPYGHCDRRVENLVQGMGYKLVMWDVDIETFPIYTHQKVLTVLAHQNQWMIDNLDKFIEDVKTRGYRFLPDLDQLLL